MVKGKSYTNWGQGLFVCKDIDGKPCYIGDEVEATRLETELNLHEIPIKLQEQTWKGILVLQRSEGVRVKVNSTYYVKPKWTNNSYVKWKIKLIKSLKQEKDTVTYI